MKIRKSFITAVFIVLLAALAIFPPQSEAVVDTNFGLVQV